MEVLSKTVLLLLKIAVTLGLNILIICFIIELKFLCKML